MNNTAVINSAMSAYKSKNYKKSVTLIEGLQRSILPPMVLGILAQSYQHLGMFNQAIDVLSQIRKWHGNSVEIQTTMASVYRSTGEFQKAVSGLQQAIEEFGEQYSLLYSLFSTYYAQKQHAKSIAMLKKLLGHKPNDLKLKIMLANCYSEFADPQSAKAVFEKLNTSDSLSPISLQAKLSLLKENGEYEEAIRFLRRHEQLVQASPYLYKELAEFIHLTGDTQEAIKILQEALLKFPLSVELLNALSQVYWLQGREDSLSPIKAVIKQNPKEVGLSLRLALNLVKMDNLGEAEEVVDHLLAGGFRHPAIAAIKGYCLRERNEIGMSLSVLGEMAELAPNDLEVRKELAATQMVAGNIDSALELCQSLITKEPWNMGSVAYYTTALKLAGRTDEYATYCNYDAFVKPLAIVVPEGYRTIEEFHGALKGELEALHQQTKNGPFEQSLLGGTQTLGNLFNLKKPVVQLLKKQLKEQINYYVDSLFTFQNQHTETHPLLGRLSLETAFSASWSVLLNNAGFHKSHFHHKGWVSSAYYVSTPDSISTDGQGWIYFGQPEISRHLDLQPDYIIKPSEGTLVLFPSYLWHGTRPFASKQKRMTVAFDLIAR